MLASGKKSGVDFVLNNNTAVQVRMPLMTLYDDKALASLGDQPKKRKEQTLDKWFGTTPPTKKAKPLEEPSTKPTPSHYDRVIILFCFMCDAPTLDPKATHFPRELVANAIMPEVRPRVFLLLSKS